MLSTCTGSSLVRESPTSLACLGEFTFLAMTELKGISFPGEDIVSCSFLFYVVRSGQKI